MIDVSPATGTTATTATTATARAPAPVRGLVFDVDKFAIHDGPGIRTTVFLKGCPLRCWWCHSPESQLGRPQLLYMPRKCTGCEECLAACPEGAIRPGSGGRVEVDWARCTNCGACAEVCYPGALRTSGVWRSADEVVAEVAKDQTFFRLSGGGVTLTGGEVTQQGIFAAAVLRGCRQRGIHTAVETAGLAPWRVFRQLAEVTDLFLYDLKQMDDARHRALTGVTNRPILDNLRRLAAGRLDGHDGQDGQDGGGRYQIVVRVPCIPGMNDDEANIAATADFVREIGLSTLHLLPYNASAAAKYEWIGQPYRLGELSTQDPATMQRLAALCAERGLSVQIGG